jgi:hypothetical protein
VSHPKNEGASDCSASPPRSSQYQQPDFAGDGADSKALATMQARAALCGCTLHQMADGAFLLASWQYSRAVPCLRAVGDLLRQIGGRP